MTRLLSFIGTGDLKETTYRFLDQTKRTRYAQEALCDFFQPDELILFATAKAQMSNCTAIHAACERKVPSIRIIPIPDGADETELWDIFSVICNTVQNEDTLIFDLTHSFRTIPFVCFLSVVYLKEIKQVSIERICYGRYEPDPDGTSPVIDITDFITILDWMMAVHTFLRQVDARELSQLVLDIHKKAHDSGSAKKPKSLDKWAGALNAFTSAVLLSRPMDAAEAAQSLMEKLEPAKADVNLFIPALVPVMDEIREIGQFAGTGERNVLTPAMLDNQWRIIEYQKQNGLILQAVELAREWFVNYIILRMTFEPDTWLDRKTRECIEYTLSYEKSRRTPQRKNTHLSPTHIQDQFSNLPDADHLVGFWGEISDIRNNLAHCGMKTDKTPVSRLLRNATSLLERIGDHYARFPVLK
jgi:hypothetical protein